MCRLVRRPRPAGVVHAAAGRRRARRVARADGRVAPRAPTPARRWCPQVAARPFGMLLGFPTRHGFSGRPTYRTLRDALSPDELLAELAKPDGARRRSSPRTTSPPDPTVLFDGLVPARAGARSTGSTRSATRRSTSPPRPHHRRAWPRPTASTRSTMLYDVMLEHDAQHLLMLPFFNYVERNHDAIREMLLHPGGVSGLSDGGAHCGLICDASIPTFMLTHWARDRYRGEHAAARVPGEEADVRHRRALRARRPRRARRRARRPTST